MKSKRGNKSTEMFDCYFRVSDIGNDKKGVHLKPNTTYSLIIDYPFDKPGTFPIKVGVKGMGLLLLVGKIKQAYDKQYATAKKDKEQSYWHGIEDLFIEGVQVNHKKKEILLFMGS